MESKEPIPILYHTYHCYLTDKGVTFYQILDNFAAGSVEGTIPWAQALAIAAKDGPLMRLRN